MWFYWKHLVPFIAARPLPSFLSGRLCSLCSLSALSLAVSTNLLRVVCLLLALVNLKLDLFAEDWGSFTEGT